MLNNADTRITYTNTKGDVIRFGWDSVYVLTGIEEDNSNDIYAEKQSGTHGKKFVSSSMNERSLTLTGFISSHANVEALRLMLIRCINTTTTGVIRYHNGTSKEKVLKVVADAVPTVQKSGGVIKFNISLKAMNPFWEEEETRENIALMSPRLTFPLVIPTGGAVFGLRKQILETEIINKGDTKTGFRVNFIAKGTVDNPSLKNMVTGEFIKFNYTMQKGDVIELTNYLDLKRVTLNHTENAFKYMHVDSSFFLLDIGKNLLQYNADTNLVNLDVVVYYTPQFLGV